MPRDTSPARPRCQPRAGAQERGTGWGAQLSTQSTAPGGQGRMLKDKIQHFLITWKCSTGISEVLEKELKTRGIPFPPSLRRNPEQ